MTGHARVCVRFELAGRQIARRTLHWGCVHWRALCVRVCAHTYMPMTWAQLASGRRQSPCVAVRARSDDGKDTSARASERAGRFDCLAERERIAVDSLPDGTGGALVGRRRRH